MAAAKVMKTKKQQLEEQVGHINNSHRQLTTRNANKKTNEGASSREQDDAHITIRARRSAPMGNLLLSDLSSGLWK